MTCNLRHPMSLRHPVRPTGIFRVNEPWHIWRSHGTYVWVMAHMNESWHIWMSHGTHMNDSCHAIQIIESFATLGMHIWRSNRYCSYEWVMAHMKESWHRYEWLMSRNTDDCVIHMTWLIHILDEWIMSQTNVSKWAEERCGWVMSHISISHVTHMYESCRT